MKNNLVKKLAVGMTALMICTSFAGCGSTDSAASDDTSSETTETTETETEESDDLSGNISLAGSTSMEKLCEALSEGFMAKYPGINVSVEYTGSSAGIESLSAGSVDIGNASRNLKDEEKTGGATENIVAIDGIALITDTENTVTNLTTEQLVSIYTGETTNWSELGGADEAIVVIGREAGSGTRGAFEELLEIEDACTYAQELDSTGAVLAKVASTPGAIGYVSLDAIDDTVTSMSLNDVAATEDTIKAGDYQLSRPFVMATMGEVTEQSELVQTWFDYINSEEGQQIVSGVGLILPE
ncbi:MAG: phosphate ABC transporter substrate-binding protein [Lachnospiraceae bacterium]|nr:phosphate ABC transporter substrate-binding protein [Lachnospiraceae bacterium]